MEHPKHIKSSETYGHIFPINMLKTNFKTTKSFLADISKLITKLID